ncbi:hypothetical protein B0T44_05705 [Nocardia donostiensis]|uniref:Uncharacterized protein n=1 Tax=Nocardia donostiensis TaxID=1538463 RepID=A0A1W0BI48_9NOCA|nr:hypothetical protein B0T46_05835 [Nocardia donostiensis]OQS13408.1 hypothetical protein B0T36_20140 [Nocardia donostiensis]OQS22153.1 hypothetical protein B0T44_05705 [Nocardia donostiensis]
MVLLDVEVTNDPPPAGQQFASENLLSSPADHSGHRPLSIPGGRFGPRALRHERSIHQVRS